MSDNNLNDLCPELRPIAEELLKRCAAMHQPIKITVTWRSATDQDRAYSMGLSNARAGQGPHDCCDAQGNPASKAIDFALFDSDGKYITNGGDIRYAQVGAIGKILGLDWGGDWHKPDYDHFELPNWNK